MVKLSKNKRVYRNQIFCAWKIWCFRLDHVHDKLLEVAGMSAVEAFDVGNLAPLAARRDLALLGLTWLYLALLGLTWPSRS